MHYIVHSKFHDDIAALKPRCERWIVSRWMFRLLAPVLPWVAYFGLVGATMAFFLMPFQVLRLARIGPSSAAYWIGASLTIALILLALALSLRRIVGGLRLRIVELDVIAGFVGIGLAAALAACLYPTGLPREQRSAGFVGSEAQQLVRAIAQSKKLNLPRDAVPNSPGGMVIQFYRGTNLSYPTEPANEHLPAHALGHGIGAAIWE